METKVERSPIEDPLPRPGGPETGADDVSTLAGGASVSLGGKILGRSLSFLGDIAAARILGPDSFGLYAIGWTVLRTLSLISPLGLDKGVIYFGSPYWRKDAAALKNILDRALALALGSGLVFGAGLYLFASVLAVQVFQKPALANIFRWYAPAFPVITVLGVAAAATRITRRMKYSTGLEDVLPPAVGLFFLIVLYLFGFRLIGVLASDVLSFAIPAVLAIWVIRRLFPVPHGIAATHLSTSREILTFSIPASLAGVFTPFLIWVDRLMVGHFRSPAETGIYQAVSQTSTIFAIILAAFAAIFMPIIADLYRKKELGRLEELFRVGTKWGLYLSLPVFTMLCIFPREILAYVFDSRYTSGALPLVILSAGQLINAGTGAIGPMLVMTGHQKRWSVLTGIALAVNICLNWYLVPLFGLTGAAVSTAVSLSSLFIIGVFQVRTVLKIWPYDRRYLKGLAAAGLAMIILLIYRAFLPVRSLPEVILATLLTGLVFLAAVLAFGLDREDRDIARLARDRVQRIRESRS
jgi:O-antigen/teichoic acid export membrane protein